jgi:hypothetical protein
MVILVLPDFNFKLFYCLESTWQTDMTKLIVSSCNFAKAPKSSKFWCTQDIRMFCMDIRTISDYFYIQYYNLSGGILLRGTKWIFKYNSSYCLSWERLGKNYYAEMLVTSTCLALLYKHTFYVLNICIIEVWWTGNANYRNLVSVTCCKNIVPLSLLHDDWT